MANAAEDGTSAPSGGRNDSYDRVVSDLASLIDQVQASMMLIEAAIASAAPLDDQDADNVVVLDDVTPRYVKANAALTACKGVLGVTLHLLQDAMPLRTGVAQPHWRP